MMNRIQGVKVYWVAVLLLLAGAILIYFNNKQGDKLIGVSSSKNSGEISFNSSSSDPAKETSDKSANSKVSKQENSAELVSHSAEYKDKVAAKKIELEALMKKFNENISDPVARDEIRAQIKRAMASYNELILPEAIQKIENSDKKVDN